MTIKEHLLKDLKIEGITINDIASVPNGLNGDYSIPCFKLAKEYKKAPNEIAKELESTIPKEGIVGSAEAVGPYINVSLNKEKLASVVLNNVLNESNYGSTSEGKDKTVCIDYSSITLSKQVHIGHLCTTVIGECLAKIYENFGYKVVRMNYLGDMGTPFGKIITMYKKYGDEELVNKNGADEIQRLYALFSKEEDNNPNIIEEARNWSLKIEQNDPEATKLCEWFKKVALDEAKGIYDLLGIKFDDWRGEAFYNEKTEEVVKLLKEKSLLKESQDAQVVDLTPYDMGVYLILRNDGGSLYSTRDLAAAISRYKDYNFHKCLYVTDVAQKLHFASFFKVLELMGYPWAKDLEHVYYGRLSTETGKISGREGNTPIMKDIFNASIEKSRNVLEGRGLPDNIAVDIGVSAVVFSVLKTERIKDAVFSLDQAISFEGNSSVYLQYSDVRLKRMLEKGNFNKTNTIYSKYLVSDEEKELLVKLDTFPEILKSALEKHEPCFISKYALELCQLINKFYNNNKVISDDADLTNARLALVKASVIVLEKSMTILGVKLVDQM